MNKRFQQILIFVVLAGFLAGCAGTSGGGVQARAYVDTRERVDQKMEGNFGYLLGEPKPEDRSQYKKDRKIYVMEFSKEPAEPEVEINIQPRKPAEPVDMPAPTARPVVKRQEPEPIVIPNFDDMDEPVMKKSTQAGSQAAPATTRSSLAPMTYVEYTVQKNDTLQKISKKFYDTYRKWQQIYDANTDVLSDPNVIKPGIKIRIPSN